MNDHTESVNIDSAAKALRQARAAVTPCEPISARFNIASLDNAYRVQATNTDYWQAGGRRIVGRKIGLTSAAVQRQIGVDQPDFGILYADMEYADGAEIPRRALIHPRAEAEVGLVLAQDCCEPDLTYAELCHRVAWLTPAIEIVDTAIADWRINLFDTVADNASSGVYVLGHQRYSPEAVDLRLSGMVMEKNGVVVSTGVGAACLGHPLRAALWLARKMAEVGRPLKAGELVMTGALGPMVDINGGEHLCVDIAGLGSVRVSIVE